MLSPENTQISNVIQTKQVAFVGTGIHMDIPCPLAEASPDILTGQKSLSGHFLRESLTIDNC